MFHYECSCGHELDIPNQATEGGLICPECGALMKGTLAAQARPRQNYLVLLMMPLGLLAAFGAWYGVRAFNEKPPNPPVVTQPAK